MTSVLKDDMHDVIQTVSLSATSMQPHKLINIMASSYIDSTVRGSHPVNTDASLVIFSFSHSQKSNISLSLTLTTTSIHTMLDPFMIYNARFLHLVSLLLITCLAMCICAVS